MEEKKINRLIKSIKKEKNNILNFWLTNSLDLKNGGFYGEVGLNNESNLNADKSLILNSRILWSFSNAYCEDEKNEYKKMAKIAYNYLLDKFSDQENGGFYWLVDKTGKPVEKIKKIYGHAFCIYAFSEYYRAFQDEKALNKASELFLLIEEKSYDSKYGGYFEAYNKDWSITENMSLSKKDLNAAKSMNTHLHILEAYTNLYRVWPNSQLETKLEELIKIMLTKVIDQENNFKLYFDRDWSSKSNIISFGHDIEGSWLIYEAALVLGNKKILSQTRATALKMASKVLLNGTAADGSIYYEFESGEIDTDRHWWPQAEALVGFINAYQLSKKDMFLEAAIKTWNYITENLLDQENGGWYWLVDENRKISEKAKINSWKSPYHNSRACYEVIKRLKSIIK